MMHKYMQALRLLTTLMKNFLLLALIVASSACSGDASVELPEEHYSYTNENQDGTGKFYMDREISWTMGHEGARWLNRKTRQQEERTDLLLANLPINPGDNIADIGAGTGFFSIPMAELSGAEGTVYAVDIQPEMLARIQKRAAKAGVTNLKLVLATEKSPALPANTIDLVLMVDAYHEFAWPREVMSAVYESLAPGGKVVLIEYRAEGPAMPILRLHKMSEQQVRREMAAVGLEFVENGDFLPQQHFLIFSKAVETL
jgi:ubiquinone/menaquinone biosynthesis C-methylase UbiE